MLHYRLPYFYVSNSALFLLSTSVLSFYIDVVLILYISWIANKKMLCSFTSVDMDHIISELIPIYIVLQNTWIIGAETKEFPSKTRIFLNCKPLKYSVVSLKSGSHGTRGFCVNGGWQIWHCSVPFNANMYGSNSMKTPIRQIYIRAISMRVLQTQ